MKKLLLLIFLFASCFLISNAQNTFQRTFGTSQYDIGRVVKQTSDKGFIILATTYYDSTYYIKTDSLGNKIWSRRINYDRASDIIETSNGDFLIVGTTDWVPSCYSPYIIKLSSSGNILWQKTYCMQYVEHFNSIREDIDGTGFIVTGEEYSNFTVLVKIDNSGSLMWVQKMQPFGTNSHSPYALSFTQSKLDSSFFVLGLYRYGGSYASITLSKYLKNGTGVWVKTVSATGMYNGFTQSGFHIEETYSGNMMLSFGNGLYYLVEVDTGGTVVANALKYYVGGNNNFHWTFANPLLDKSIFFSYSTYNNTDIIFSKTNSAGNILWTKIIGGVKDEVANSIVRTSDNGVAITGFTKSFSAGQEDVYLIKTDSAGTFSCNTNSYPFPAVSDTAATTDTLSFVFSTPPSTSVTPVSFSITNTNDTIYDACICVPPTASFFTDYPNPSFGINNTSLWETSWYWDFGNGNTDTTANPYYQYAIEDTFYVCLIVSNTCGSDTFCDSINYHFPPLISVTEIFNDEGISLSPNPFTDIINIAVKRNDLLELDLFDITSRRILQQKFTNFASLSTEHLSKGVYIYEVSNKNGVIAKGKVMKQ